MSSYRVDTKVARKMLPNLTATKAVLDNEGLIRDIKAIAEDEAHPPLEVQPGTPLANYFEAPVPKAMRRAKNSHPCAACSKNRQGVRISLHLEPAIWPLMIWHA